MIIACRCGAEITVNDPASVVTCMCGSRHVWARMLARYVADPLCRDCGAPALAYRNGYDETVFFCDAHEWARWAVAP